MSNSKESLKEKLISHPEDELQNFSDELYGIVPGIQKNRDVPETITMIPIQKLIPYKEQRFRMYSQEKLEELADDIANAGLLSPLVVRPFREQPGCFEILSGRNRAKAFELLGKEKIPCFIREADDSRAKLIVSSANLQQRRDLLPSEEAYGYKMQLDALTILQIAVVANTNRKNIYRYLRLTELIDGLLNMVDDNLIPIGAGIDLSYCPIADQYDLLDFISENDINKISASQSSDIKRMSERKVFSQERLHEIFFASSSARNKDKPPTFKLPSEQIVPLIPPDENIEDYIVRALKYFQSHSSGLGGDYIEAQTYK